jgi:Mycobacterium membrane protein
MTKLIGRAWIPMVMVIVLAIRAFTVSRLRGDFGSYVSAPDSGAADLIVQFKPEGMICEVYGPAGRVARRSFAVLVTASERCRRQARY